jgi:hypothetical protein
LASASLIQLRLQGVDLRLDQFDLTDVKRISSEVSAADWASDVKVLDHCVDMGSAFFACLDGNSSSLRGEDRALLSNVFNPCLSDRRSEADVFVPPDASQSHVQKLRDLVKEEELVRERRKERLQPQK